MGSSDLAQLADAYDLETSYVNMLWKTCHSPTESILAVLRLLGAPLDRTDQAADALQERQQTLWQKTLDPIVLAWDGCDGTAVLRLPVCEANRSAHCSLELESGQTIAWDFVPSSVNVSQTAEVAGITYHEHHLALPSGLPLGYHRLCVELGGGRYEATVIASPMQCYRPENGQARTWGVFLPLYALRTERDCGVGDFTDLGNLLSWTRQQGGSLVGALPLMASFLNPDENVFEPSPYAPASRLFWNEVYLDVEQIAASVKSPAAQAQLTSVEFRRQQAELRELPMVDYQRVMALKRSILDDLAAEFFAGPSCNEAAFRTFVEKNPRVEDYARFRATGQRQCASWWCWPERQREGTIREGDFDEAAFRYHLFVQWQCQEQLATLKDHDGQGGLYLDLPLGSSSDGYDVWRERDLFVQGAAVGAPPDDFAIRGQNWGFFPLHPERQREQGYRYLREVLGNMMRFAHMIRMDHLPGLHRMFFIPSGASPTEGVFVRYPHEELYAVFCLESHRHRVVLMGEDAGVLPASVPPAMDRHQINHLYIAQFQYRPQSDGSPPVVPENSVASLSTHDLATFAAYWRGLDMDDRRELGLMDAKSCRNNARAREYARIVLPRLLINGEKRGIVKRIWQRAASELSAWLPASWSRRRWSKAQEFLILKSLLKALAESQAHAVVVNLEDLWLSPEAQNVPGTWKERPNWQRRAAHTLEELMHMPEVCDTLQEIDCLRKDDTPLLNIETVRRSRRAA